LGIADCGFQAYSPIRNPQSEIRMGKADGRKYGWLGLDWLPPAFPLMGGEEEAALRAQAQRLGLSESVDFLGAVAPGDLAPHYRAADVVVLPSRREGLGLVLVEALFCRRPVIGTRVGGIPDVVADGETGLLVPPDDPLVLAEAIARLLNDPALAARLAAAGYAHVRQHFSGHVVAQRMADVYRQALTGRHSCQSAKG
jgi:glycosyltransferase involved in cell wall biosynthesis